MAGSGGDNSGGRGTREVTQATAVEMTQEETKRNRNKQGYRKDQNDYYNTRLCTLN